MKRTLTHEAADGSTVSVSSASDDALGVLAAIAASARQVAHWRLEAVTQAREQGRSWAEIGEALGMSKQAAWEQFSEDVGEMLLRIRERSGLDEDEAMQLAKQEIRAMRAERRARGG